MANKSFRWRKWIVIVIVAAAVFGGGFWYFAGKDDAAPQYQSVTVTRGDLTQAVTASGTLNPVTNITVGSQISGIIQKLYADWNSPVKAGQVVAQLDPATYQANVRSAEADLANTRANLELAQIQAKRATELFKNKLIAEADYDTTAATLHQSEAMVQIKQASLDNAKVNLARCTIYSPVDGTVISRSVDVGQTVAASLSAPTLFVIANDLAQMQIDANVSEADIGSVEEGQNVSFSVDAFPDRKFTGKVRQIRNSPITVQNVVTYDTVIDVSNRDLKLRPGMTANASIITAQRNNALKIPNAALRFRPPEPGTNESVAARLLAKMGLGGKETKTPVTNAVAVARPGDTNKTELAANSEPPLTGNEPPEELARRVREMRARGEEVPAEIGAKIRELYQSGVLQRPAGGRGGGGGGGGFGGGGGARPRAAQPSLRTIYTLTNTPASGEVVPTPLPVRVRTGISDGAYTEITEGLKEGDIVITAVKLPQAEIATAPGGTSPFGGGGFRGGGGGGGGRGGGR